MRLAFWNRAPKTPDEVAARIKAKAERRAAKIHASGKAASMLDDAREGHYRRSIAVRVIDWSGKSLLIAALLIIMAGYWYDILFYTQQTDNLLIMIGLLVFAIVARTVASAGDVILHWTRSDSDDAGQVALVGSGSLRRWLRALWVASILACSFATLSFFSSGHESRQTAQAGITTIESTSDASKAERIAVLEGQRASAKVLMDTAIATAQDTIDSTRDQVAGLSREDNVTIREANANKDKALAKFEAKSDEIDAAINVIQLEREAVADTAAVSRVTAVPFLAVYKFLSRMGGTAKGWAIGGAFFFALLFELLCAKLMAISFFLMKMTSRVAKQIQMREASEEMNTRIELQRMRSNIELDEIRLNALHMQERAEADIELARRERQVEKAKSQAEALREGRPWVDPDEMLEEQAELIRAENQAKIEKMRAQAKALREGEVDPDDLPEDLSSNDNNEEKPDPTKPMDDADHWIQKSIDARRFLKEARGFRIPVPETLSARETEPAA